ncbi:MAG: LemA family protein [Tenericutes bacterium]|jgi:LemA protein|nr:LemA family protein [Mycoplasmatota bacterium]
MEWIIVLVFIVLILGIWFFSTYNKLIILRNRKDDQWAQIEVQLKRRFDLIPNLVETVKGYAKHEKNTFEEIVKARNNFNKAKSPEEEMKIANDLTKAVTHLFALAEAYPELKANENFLSLQSDLKDTEDKISIQRQFYNDTVLNYNNKVEMIPSNIVASIGGFKKSLFFEIDTKEKENPKVAF